MKSLSSLLLLVLLRAAHSFVPASQPRIAVAAGVSTFQSSSTQPSYLSSSSSSLSMSLDNGDEKFGGYTVKQRLREEVESPFRTVRLFFFGSSTGSALVALYFSLLSLLKSYTGGYSDALPLNEALQNVGINIAAVVVCAAITYRDWQAGESNLKRIAKGGALAKLVVSSKNSVATPLADYRRKQRILIAAGGKEYIETMCRSLNSDQLSDTNTIPEALYNSEVVVVPVLLQGDGTQVGDTVTCWKDTTPGEGDRNFDISKSEHVVAFPRGTTQWADYLESEVETAKSQGFDVLEKGFIILVKKNGKILRRTTGLPPWNQLVGTMEVMDGSKFGMPGDDEKYYTP